MPDLRVINGGNAEPANTRPAANTQILGPHASGDVVPAALPIGDANVIIEPGASLGNYLILSKLGEGGMGVVYKAHDSILNRTVALKVLSPQLFANKDFMQRFRTEAQAQARLNGPNIVTLHAMHETEHGMVLVMEYVEGQTLAQRIQNHGHLSLGSAVWIFEQALVGVERAHQMGIVHRDLKPGNVFITAQHEVKLMDFGVARMLDSRDVINNAADKNTVDGSMVGTLLYIPPEQINGRDADFRSDVYTLGVSLFEAVTGRLPFENKTDYELMHAHLHTTPPRPSSLQPSVPKELEAVILKALEKDPDRRYQTARDFRSALLKVGMIHVRAYRRLKAHQRERERASPPAVAGQGGSASYRSLPDIPNGWFEGLIQAWRQGPARTIAGAVVVTVAVAVGAYVLHGSTTAPTVAPDESTVPTASQAGTDTPATTATAKPSDRAAGNGHQSEAAAATSASAETPRTVPVNNTSKPVAKKPRKDKYEALRKAWGSS